MKADLASRLRANLEEDHVRSNGGRKCLTCYLPSEVLEFLRVEAARPVPLARLARALRKEGYPIRDATLQAHFRDHEHGR